MKDRETAVCNHRCKPPCEGCLEGARATSLGRPLEPLKRRWETAWEWTFIVLGVASYYLYTIVPSGWQLMTMGLGGLLVIVGLLGPYQFRVYREAARAENGQCARCGYGLSGIDGEFAVVRRDRFTLLACPKCGTWNGRRPPRAG